MCSRICNKYYALQVFFILLTPLQKKSVRFSSKYFYHSLGKFRKENLIYFFLICPPPPPPNGSDISCKLSPCMKCQSLFSGKNTRKYISECLLSYAFRYKTAYNVTLRRTTHVKIIKSNLQCNTFYIKNNLCYNKSNKLT